MRSLLTAGLRRSICYPLVTTRDTRIRRLIYRSRSTGTKELDQWLSRFAAATLKDLSDDALDEYEQLLELPAGDLWDWLSGQTLAPRDGPVARALAAFRLAP